MRKPIESYRELYPVTERRTWLNHASMGTYSRPVIEALNGYIHEHSVADFTIESHLEMDVRIRRAVASFIGAETAEIAFTKNTPDGLNIVANGLDWSPGDRVVIADQEFPANVYPWLNLQRKGVEVVRVKSVDGRVPLEEVLGLIEGRTRLVSLSWVEFMSGFRNDIASIAAACRSRDVIFCVDAIQALGVFPIDIHAVGVDILATSSHKWLLSPTGVGWMYVRKGVLERIAVTSMGQSSVVRNVSLDYLNFDLPLWPDARRFEPGIHNQLGLIGLEAAIGLFNEVGLDRVRDRVKHLTDLAVTGLRERGYTVLSSRDGEEWSGAVCFSSPRYSAEEIHSALGENDVVISLRKPIVRLSPHYYNNEEDISRFLQALPRH